MNWGWMIHITVWVLSHSFFNCALVFCSLISCLFLKRVEHDSCCACFFVYHLFSLSHVPLSRSYWKVEFAVSLMLSLM